MVSYVNAAYVYADEVVSVNDFVALSWFENDKQIMFCTVCKCFSVYIYMISVKGCIISSFYLMVFYFV